MNEIENMTNEAVATGKTVSTKPWTTDDVRQSSHHWTLAGDAALLTKLQDMAQDLVSMTHKVQQDVDSLMLETSCSHSKLGNVINEFLMLSNTQFVENRVYDEEIVDTSAPPKKEPATEKSTEQHRAEIVEKVSKALQLGLSVIETSYEQLDIQNSDSEEEDGETVIRYAQEPILRPKDPYRGRPLPCIIGSPAFLEDDYVGLQKPIFSEDDHIGDEDVESDASVEETTPKNANVLLKDYSSGDEVSVHNEVSGLRERHDSGKSGGSDLFDPHTRISDNGGSPSLSFEEVVDERISANAKRPSKTADFQKELSDKLRPNRRQSESENDASIDGPKEFSKQVVASRNSVAGQNKISEQKFAVEDDDDDDDLFAPRAGLFTAKGKLFDTSGDEDLLFGGRPSEKQMKSSDARDSSRDISGVMSSMKNPESLFDDDDDVTPAKQLPVTRKDAKGMDSLFDEVDHDSLFATDEPIKVAKSSATTKKVLPGAVSMFGGSVDPLTMGRTLKQTSGAKPENKASATSGTTAVPKKKNAVLEDDDVGRPGSGNSSRSSRSVSSMRDANAVVVDGTAGGGGGAVAGRKSPTLSVASRSSANLFAEEPQVDDDLFSSSAVTKRKPIGGISLFDDDADEDEFDDIFAPTAAAKKSAKAAEPASRDTSSDFFDDILAQIVKPRESLPKTSVVDLFDDTLVPLAPKDTTNSKPAKVDDLFQSVSAKPPRKVSLFDDDDEDLFTSPSSSKQAQSSLAKKPLSSGSGPRQSLFFEDEESLLFGVDVDVKESAQSASTSSAAAAPRQSFRLPFDDDRLDVDLFQQSSKMKKDAKTSENTEETKSRATSSVRSDADDSSSKTTVKSNTFADADDEDEDEDDLFSTKKDKKAVLEKPNKNSEASTASSSVELPLERRKSDEASNKGDHSEKVAGGLAKSELPFPSPSPSPLSSPSKGLLESPSRKKPPVGGVPLFGGVLTPVLKPKTPRDKSPAGVREDIPSSMKSTLSPKLLPQAASDEPSAKTAVDFDNPVKANPLHNANKDRIKISVKRRPSTRRGRQEALRRSAIDILPSDDDDTAATDGFITDAATSSAPISPATPDPDFAKELSNRCADDGDDNPDDGDDDDDRKSASPSPPSDDKTNAVPSAAKSKATSSSSAQGKNTVSSESSDSDEGLFGPSKAKSDLTTTSSAKKNSIPSDSKSGDDLFSSLSTSTKVGSKSDDLSASLFGTSSSKGTTSRMGRGKSLFDEDDDDDDDSEDIFKSVPKKMPSSSTTSSSSSVRKSSAASTTATQSSSDALDKSGGLFDDPLMVNKNDP